MQHDRVERPDSRYSWLVALVGAVAMVFTFATPVVDGIFRAPFSDAFGISSICPVSITDRLFGSSTMI